MLSISKCYQQTYITGRYFFKILCFHKKISLWEVSNYSLIIQKFHRLLLNSLPTIKLCIQLQKLLIHQRVFEEKCLLLYISETVKKKLPSTNIQCFYFEMHQFGPLLENRKKLTKTIKICLIVQKCCFNISISSKITEIRQRFQNATF